MPGLSTNREHAETCATEEREDASPGLSSPLATDLAELDPDDNAREVSARRLYAGSLFGFFAGYGRNRGASSSDLSM